MKTIVLAFVAGAAISAAIAMFLNTPRQQHSPSAPAPEAPVAPVAPQTNRMISAPPIPEVDAAAPTAESITALASTAEQTAADIPVPQADQVITISVPQRPQMVMPDGTDLGRLSAATHAEIELESIDPDWAPMVESELFNFIAQNPELLDAFRNPLIQCRSSMCLIQVTTDDESRVFRAWNEEGSKLFDQTWGTQFGQHAHASHTYATPEGQTAFLWYLKKNLQPQQAR